jgi:hypothetical protein
MNESPSTPSGFRFKYRWPWIDTTSAIAAASHICPRQVDAYIDQLSVADEDEGARTKLLEREMVMATLFAESETFVLANRPETRVRSSRIPSRVGR